MKNNLQGYILFFVLIFLQIFSLLILYGLESVTNQIRLSREGWQEDLLFQQAMLALSSAEMEVDPNDTCQIPITVSEQIAQKSISWWQENACYGAIEKGSYYYVVENLGVDSCGICTENTKNQLLSPHYYRLTLIYLPLTNFTQKIILQSTITKADNTPQQCAEKSHFVSLGRQMWREL